MRGIYKVPFHADETTTSLAIRLASANGLSPYPFCEDMGFSFESISQGRREALTRLSEVAHVPAEQVFRNAYIGATQGAGVFRGEKVRSPWITRYTSRVCPDCLEDDYRSKSGPPSARRYFRVYWHFTAIRSCPVHNAPLFQLPHITSARAFDLDTRAAISARELRKAAGLVNSTPFTPFEQFVLDRLEGRKQAGTFLDGMSMVAAIDVSELMGMFATFGKHANLHSFTENEWQNGAQAGYELLKQGPEGIRTFGRLMTTQTNSRRSAYGGSHLLGGVASILNPKRRVGSDYDAVRLELLNFIKETVSIAGKCMVFGQRLTQTHVGLVEASKQLKRNQIQTKNILAHFGDDTDKTVTVFSSDVVERARSYLADLLWPIEAQKVLGVNRAGFEHLVGHGLIAHDPLYPQLFPGSLLRYSKASLQRLLGAALGIEPVSSSAGLFSIFKATQRARVMYGNIVALLLDGKLKKVFYDQNLHGLDSIMVDPVEVASHFKVDSKWMLSDEVAALVGLTIQQVRLMARENLVSGHKLNRIGYPPTTMFFDRDEVKRFHEKYVSAPLLGEQTKLGALSVAQRLRRTDTPKIRARKLVFYERVGAEAELAKLQDA